MRRMFIASVLIASVWAAAPDSTQAPSGFPLEEATVGDLQDAMAAGGYTSRRLVELYTERISAIDRSGPTLRSVIELNPDALAIADGLDAERKTGGGGGSRPGLP